MTTLEWYIDQDDYVNCIRSIYAPKQHGFVAMICLGATLTYEFNNWEKAVLDVSHLTDDECHSLWWHIYQTFGVNATMCSRCN